MMIILNPEEIAFKYGANVNINGINTNIKLVDCVGFVTPEALGYMDELGNPRMVKTPWQEEEMPFEKAAEIGTKKVIQEHSTIGILITTDGSFSEISREDYVGAEERVVSELKAINKPFIVLLNSEHPENSDTINLASTLAEKYKSTVLPINCAELDISDINNIFSKILYEFPVSQVNFSLPKWINGLDFNHPLKQELFTQIEEAFSNINLLKDTNNCISKIAQTNIITRNSG